MVQNNKVLTVSYGTFSCTLEGFDDSFETMKAIAEYFRDLAADDRYFGSEPPQPDAEMLTRIAQRDIARKVEASQNDSGLLLRATEETPAVAATPVAAMQPQAVQPASVQPEVPDMPIETPNLGAAAPSAAPQPTDDSIAAKLQRIRAVVSHNDEAPARLADEEDEENGFLATAKPKVDAISAAFEAGALSPADLQDQPAPAPQTEVEATPTQETFVEPQPVADAAPLTDVETPVDPSPVVEAEPVAEAQDIAEPEPVSEPPFDVDDMPEALEFTVDEQATEDEPAEVEDLDQALPPLVLSATVQDDDTDSAPEMDAELDVSTNDVLFSEVDDQPDADIDLDEIQNILDADETDMSDAQDDDADAPEFARNVLSVEDEALLLDEIALVEAELTARDSDETQDATEEPAAEDQDVSRLMDTAGARMEDPDTADQLKTYSHLRAAVAATQAERADSAGKPEQPADHQYRGDLESVVSPRRPEVHVTSDRPQSAIAAPLKLVAEQRIDPETNDTAPVMPRRVKQAEEDMADDEGGFAHFAKEQGAQSLPDLLEAAAAYLSFIEGQEQFSRPQLMNKVRSLKQDEFNREESLRSFGQLLRDGKIEKAGGGRFAASTDIGFRPNDKRAAG